jgi:hypothetical protein
MIQFGETRMAQGNAVSRAIKWIMARCKSLPAVVLRAIVANLLSTGDLASDLYTIESLFALGHDGPASALLTMVCLSFVGHVSARMRFCEACDAYRDHTCHGSAWASWCGRRR